MHLIELFLPADARFEGKRRELARALSDRFGGMTAFTRAPAQGLFEDAGKQVADDVVVFEIMTRELDRAWWQAFREGLETEFKQKEILLRTSTVERL